MLKVMPANQQNKVRLLYKNVQLLLLAVFIMALVPVGKLHAQDASELYLMGAAALRQGNYDQAEGYLTSALTGAVDRTSCYMKRGEAFYRMRQYERALSDFLAAGELQPGVGDLWLARTYACLGSFEQSLSFLRKHLASPLHETESLIRKDDAFDRLQYTDGWYDLWEQEWYSQDEKLLSEVAYYSGRGNTADAFALVDRGIAEKPGNASLLNARGKLNVKAGNYAAAIADFSAAIQADRNNGEYLAARGFAYCKAGRYKDAISDFNRVLAADPGYFDAYTGRAEAYAASGSYDLAARDLQTYLKYFPGDLPSLFLSGEYSFRQGKYIQALDFFNLILKADPDNAAYYKARGKTYLMTRTYGYAIRDLTMSLDLDPDDGETYRYLGQARLASGDAESACSDFEKARRLGDSQAVKYILENCR